MKNNLKIALVIILSLTVFGCNEDDSPNIRETLTLKFINNSDLSYKGTSNYTTHEVEIISMSPFQIKSTQLELKEIINPETSKPTYLILEINNDSIENKSSLAAKVTSRRGFAHDGGNCWVIGTWIEDDVSGVAVFVPAPLHVQAISNVCGWPYDEIA